jgi:hypothetical protein
VYRHPSFLPITELSDTHLDKSIMLHSIQWSLTVHKPMQWKLGYFLTYASAPHLRVCRPSHFKDDLPNSTRSATRFRMVCHTSLGTCFFATHLTLPQSGPCQFPTLGFVVSRYTQVKSFTPEAFWYIFLSLSRSTSPSSAAEETQFNWRRGHLFDWEVAVAIYQHVLNDTLARVVKVVQKPTKKW